MRGKALFIVRRLHLYLSVFFAPLLLLFVVTGWAQTMGFDHSSALMSRLSQVHKRQVYTNEATKEGGHRQGGFNERAGGFNDRFGGERGHGAPPRNGPMKWLVSAMCVALIVSISLGLILAFTMVHNRLPVWIALILGVATPVVLLALGK
jgi:hypothetical protein